jgi:hypothetical protein
MDKEEGNGRGGKIKRERERRVHIMVIRAFGIP